MIDQYFHPIVHVLIISLFDELMAQAQKLLGSGTFYISPTLILKSVLFVPKLDRNLISINKLNRDLNYETKFVANSCVFQDLESGKMIGNAEYSGGLYLLKVKDSPINPNGRTLSPQCRSISSIESVSHSNKDSTVMLWHYCLGHPNFLYLKHLFSSLFINKNPQLFQCNICQLSMHTQSHYAPKNWGHLGTIKNSKYYWGAMVFTII